MYFCIVETKISAFQHKKARVARYQNKQREILFNTVPSIQKSLGNRVKGLDDTAWSGQKRDIMKDILIAKFTQHEDLRNYLLSTKDKKLLKLLENTVFLQ